MPPALITKAKATLEIKEGDPSCSHANVVMRARNFHFSLSLVRARMNVFSSERQPAPIPFLIAFAFNNRAGEFPRRARLSRLP